MAAAALAIKSELQAEWSQRAKNKGAKEPSQESRPINAADISLTTLTYTRIWGNIVSVTKDERENGFGVDNLESEHT